MIRPGLILLFVRVLAPLGQAVLILAGLTTLAGIGVVLAWAVGAI